jgi:ISXO2-like transposase domain
MKLAAWLSPYSLNGACVNWAESYFSRLRRSEIGHHHHLAGPFLLRYAQESSWREDNCRMSNGDQVKRLAGLAMIRRSHGNRLGLQNERSGSHWGGADRRHGADLDSAGGSGGIGSVTWGGVDLAAIFGKDLISVPPGKLRFKALEVVAIIFGMPARHRFQFSRTN